jgi:hypothetical protein
MKLLTRLQKLENKFDKTTKHSAIFIMRYYDDSSDQERVKSAILNEHLMAGYPMPHLLVFIQDAGSQKEGFCSFF